MVPGELAEEWEDSGETWSAWHGGRTIWFTSWSVQGENDETLGPSEILDSRPWPDEGEIFEHEDGALLGRAVFMPCEEDGQVMWNLKGYSAVEGNFALCNIYLQDKSDLRGPWRFGSRCGIDNDYYLSRNALMLACGFARMLPSNRGFCARNC